MKRRPLQSGPYVMPLYISAPRGVRSPCYWTDNWLVVILRRNKNLTIYPTSSWQHGPQQTPQKNLSRLTSNIPTVGFTYTLTHHLVESVWFSFCGRCLPVDATWPICMICTPCNEQWQNEAKCLPPGRQSAARCWALVNWIFCSPTVFAAPWWIFAAPTELFTASVIFLSVRSRHIGH